MIKKRVGSLRSLNARALSATSKQFIGFIELAINTTMQAIRNLLQHNGGRRYTHIILAGLLISSSGRWITTGP